MFETEEQAREKFEELFDILKNKNGVYLPVKDRRKRQAGSEPSSNS
jgi:hypothetical protein